MNASFVRAVFVILVCLGLLVVLWGTVGQYSTGSEFGRILIRDLGLPKNDAMADKAATTYRRVSQQDNTLVIGLGIGIVVLAIIGFAAAWKIKDPDEDEWASRVISESN